MASSATRFEVILPLFSDGTSQANAVAAFISNMESLCTVNLVPVYPNTQAGSSQGNLLFGFLTAGQQSTALGYLNTLNAALGSNCVCYIWSVTLEP